MFLSRTKNTRIYDIRSYINIINYKYVGHLEIKYDIIKNYKTYSISHPYITKLLNIYTELHHIENKTIINISNKFNHNTNAILCIDSDDVDIDSRFTVDNIELCPGYLCIIDNIHKVKINNLTNNHFILGLSHIKQ